MRTALILSLLAGINILLTFIYQWYVVTTIGPGAETDALFAGMVVPQLVLAVVSGSLTHVLVPLLATEDVPSFQQDAWCFFQGIGLLFGGIATVLFVTAGTWVPLTVPGFNTSTKLLTISLTRIQLISMVFMALNAVLLSVNHARQKFVFVEIITILATACGFAFLLWGLPRFGITLAAWAMVLKVAIQTILLLPGMGSYRKPDWHSGAVKEAWKRLRPLLLGTIYYKSDQLIDRFLASMTLTGGLSLLHLAQQIYAAGNQILNKAVTSPMVPLLAQKASNGDWQSFRAIIRSRLLWVLGITGTVFVCILLAGQLLLALLFGHNRFGEAEVLMLWRLLIALVGVWIGGAIGLILSASFYAKGNTIVPTRIGVIGYTLGIGFKIAGFFIWGVTGIAAGTTLYYFFNVFLFLIAISRHLRERLQES